MDLSYRLLPGWTSSMRVLNRLTHVGEAKRRMQDFLTKVCPEYYLIRSFLILSSSSSTPNSALSSPESDDK
jgi:hypothetical protein